MTNSMNKILYEPIFVVCVTLVFNLMFWTYAYSATSLSTPVVTMTHIFYSLFVSLMFFLCGAIRHLRMRCKLCELLLSVQKIDIAIASRALDYSRDLQFYTRSLIESNLDSMMVMNSNGVIIDASRHMELLTGYTHSELVGSSFKAYFTDSESAQRVFSRVIHEKSVTNYDLVIRTKNGREISVSYNLSVLLDSDQNRIGVIASARDVTNNKQFEYLLEKNNLALKNAKAVAEKANLAKSEFLSSMSHELRTPLNAILGFAQLMDVDPCLPKATEKLAIRQILQGGWYLLDLINEILDLASIESGKAVMSHETVSLFDVLTECKSMIEQQAHKKDVNLIFPLFDHATMYVNADQTRMKQVMINLLSNAIKYNKKGGEVHVECTSNGASFVRISVRDTGFGLSSEQLSHLFEPFNRLGRQGSSEDGTGIGLVVTKQLVELMGGHIGVQSSIEVGSLFWIELPLALNQHPVLQMNDDSATASCNVKHQGKIKKTVLCIEDNLPNLALIEQVMHSRTNIELLTANTGAIGIQLAKSYLPDVILMDINLPDIHGFEILKILRECNVTSGIPVIGLSSNAMQIDIENGLMAGCRHYLTKPVKVRELMATVDAALYDSGHYLELQNESV